MTGFRPHDHASKKNKANSPGVDAVTRFDPVLVQNPALLGSFRVGGFDVGGFSVATADGVLVGQRVGLRPLGPSDCAAWLDLQASQGDAAGDLGTINDQTAFDRRCESIELASMIGVSDTFGVFLGQQLVGELEVALLTAAGLSSAFASLWLDGSAQHQGVATEACVLVAQHVFEQRGMQRLEFAVPPERADVRRSLERAHLRDEGVAVGYAPVDGTWADHVRYAMTTREWTEHRDELLAIAKGDAG